LQILQKGRTVTMMRLMGGIIEVYKWIVQGAMSNFPIHRRHD